MALEPASTGSGSGADPGPDFAVEDLRMPAAFEPLAAPPVFISGFSRSGTSLTLDLFARHPAVSSIFESWLLTPDWGVTGLFRQPQWNRRFYESQLGKIGHPHAAVQLVSYERAAADLGELLGRWLMRAMGPGRSYLVEKSPLDAAALTSLFPDARLVHVIRDGRDVLMSTKRAATSWAPEMVGKPEAVARRWCTRVRALRDGSRHLRGGVLEIRFESLRADTAGVARRLLSFANIPYDEALLEQIVRGTLLSAYPDHARSSGFRGQGEIGAWRESMTRSAGRRFDAAAGDLLVELGYADDRSWWRDLPTRPFARGGRRAGSWRRRLFP